MSGSRYFIGILGLLLLSSITSAYTNDSTAFYCTNCTDCTAALNNNTYNITYLNATISGAAGTCINDPDNIDGKTFNCNGYAISGTGTGSGILISGETDAWIYGCVVSGFLYGIVVDDSSDNVTVEYSDTLNNGNAGVFVQSSSNINVLDVVSAHNSLYGIRVQFSDGCYLNGNAVENNTYGFDIDGSDLNTLNNSIAFDNSLYGVYIRNDADNNSIWNTFAYNNLDSGFMLSGLNSNFNRIYSSDATNNTNDGFYLTSNNWTWITDTTSYLNGRDGYRFQSSIWINLTNGTSYDNTGNGYSYSSGTGYLVAYSKAYNNSGYGLNAWGPTTINFLTFSEIYNNGLDGVFIEDGSHLQALRNDTIYGNTGWGFYAYNAHYHLAVNVTIYDNAGGGMAFDNSDDGNYTNLVLYNNSFANSYAMEIYGTGNRFNNVLIYNETNYIYNYPDATPNNFTNLTVGYNAEVGLINWGFLSITNVDLNSSNIVLDPYFVSLDSSVASQANASANVSIYADSWYDIYRADGFPQSRDAILNSGYIYAPLSRSWANGILRFGVADFSGYAAKANCFYANESDTIYNITADLVGNKSDAICITINASNVTIQCNGHTVTGDFAGTTYGMRTTASVQDVTILDCIVSNYSYGIRFDNTITSSAISNTTSYNNSVDGVYLGASVSYVNLTDCTAYDNTGDGFDFQGNNNIVLYGVAHDNGGSGYNSLGANNYTDTVSYDNGGAGFTTASASGEIFVNCTAYGNTVGFGIGGGNERVYNSTARDNIQYGFYFIAQNTLCSNCEAYGNDGGLYMSRNTTVNGATLYNNSNSGSGYEVYIATLVDEPTVLADVFMYDASKFIYKESTATQFNFTNLTIGYNDTIGLANWAFVNLTDLNLTTDNFIVDPEFISMNSSDSNAVQMNASANLTIGTPTCVDVYPRVKTGFPQSAPDIRFNGSACPTCNLYSCVANVGQFDVPDWSGYALGPNISECMIINSSGNYYLNNNVEGAPIPFGNIWLLSNTCILIESSNVSFSCNGYNITNNGTANAAGIAINASFAVAYTNITIRDCPGITKYTDGIYMQNADYNRIQNVTSYNNSEGFLIINGQGNNFTDNIAHGPTMSVGFDFTGLGYNNLFNNTAYRTTNGFSISTCNYNNLTDNWAYNNSIGYHIEGDGNQLWYNRAQTSFQYGFQLRNADNNYLVNNSAWGGPDGFFVDGNNLGANGNWLINNTASNSNRGFYLYIDFGTGVANTRLIGNTAYLNTYGYYLDTVTNTNLTDNVARDNTNTGFFLTEASGTTVKNLAAYRNPRGLNLGDSVLVGSDLHIYNTTVYGLRAATTGGTGYSINVTNITIDNPAGDYTNYTAFDVNDSAPSGSVGYTMTWNTQPAIPPITHFSFAQKYTNIAIALGAPSIDLIRWTWLDSELAGYDETKFEVWEYSATWSNVSGQTLDAANNYIEILGFSPTSVYGILQNNNSAPSLTVESPQNISYDVDTVDLNYTVSDVNLDSCWYYLDGSGPTTLPGCANTTLGPLLDGPHNITVFVNDTLGLQNSSTVYFITDTTSPTVSIQSPQNTTYNISTPDLNYTVGDNVGIDSCWYYLDGAGPTALVGCANVTPLPALGDGPHNITVFVNDTANHTASDTVYFVTDATPPTVTIDSPTNTTYNTTNDVDLNYTAGDNVGLDSCWYYLNGAGPTPLPGCTNITLAGLPNGPYNLTMFVNDTAGNMDQDNVSFTVDVPAPPPSGGARPTPRCTDASVTLTYMECPDNKVLFTVINKDTGAPAVDARVVIKGPWPWSDVRYAASDGVVEFFLPVDGHYQVFADGGRTEDYCSDTFELDYVTCPEDFCYDDDDCRDTEYCDLGGVVYSPEMPPEVLSTLVVGGLCRPVECECGDVYDHRCHPYECCADADCERGYVCEEHECVYQPECESDAQCAEREYCSDGACIPIQVGECGFVENHTWFDYECCKDEDCPPGLLCFEHICKLYRIETNETGYVGDRHGVQVYPEGQYDLTMTDPDGRQFTVTTNENGYATFVLEIEGEYGVALVEDDESLATVDVQSLKRPLPPEEERPLIWLEELLKFFWWLLILLLLVIGYILFRRRKKKRYRAGE